MVGTISSYIRTKNQDQESIPSPSGLPVNKIINIFYIGIVSSIFVRDEGRSTTLHDTALQTRQT